MKAFLQKYWPWSSTLLICCGVSRQIWHFRPRASPISIIWPRSGFKLSQFLFTETCWKFYHRLTHWGGSRSTVSSWDRSTPAIPGQLLSAKKAAVLHDHVVLSDCLHCSRSSQVPAENTIRDGGSTARCKPPIFSPDICAKSESNPKCLRKSLHQTHPKRRVFATKPVLRQKRVFSTKPFSWQKRVFVELQLGHVIISMIPATSSMHENHAFDHN